MLSPFALPLGTALSADSMSLRLATVHENSLAEISPLFSIAAPAIFMAAKEVFGVGFEILSRAWRLLPAGMAVPGGAQAASLGLTAPIVKVEHWLALRLK